MEKSYVSVFSIHLNSLLWYTIVFNHHVVIKTTAKKKVFRMLINILKQGLFIYNKLKGIKISM